MFMRSHEAFAACDSRLAKAVWEPWPLTSTSPKWKQWDLFSDILELEDCLEVKADVPGIDPKALKVEVEPGRLTIRGTRHYHHGTRHSKGRHHWVGGAFLRRFALPDNLKVHESEAAVRHGILTVTIPKNGHRISTRIPIKKHATHPDFSELMDTFPHQRVAKWWHDIKSWVVDKLNTG